MKSLFTKEGEAQKVQLSEKELFDFDCFVMLSIANGVAVEDLDFKMSEIPDVICLSTIQRDLLSNFFRVDLNKEDTILVVA